MAVDRLAEEMVSIGEGDWKYYTMNMSGWDAVDVMLCTGRTSEKCSFADKWRKMLKSIKRISEGKKIQFRSSPNSSKKM